MRYCAECGSVLVRRQNEKPGRFAARQFCSVRCSAAKGSRAAQAKALAQPPPSKTIERNGYLMVYTRGVKPPPSQANQGGWYCYVHRLVMEAHLGRKLANGEVVHHINGDKHDNRIENLRLYESHSEHRRDELARGEAKPFWKGAA